MSRGYKWLQQSQPKVSWYRGVWSKFNVPKHSFISWLAMSGKLRTKAWLKKINICDDDICSVCGKESESIEHLFFSCEFSKVCWDKMKNWMQMGCQSSSILQNYRWVDRVKTSKFKRSFWYAGITASIYQIWMHRNLVVWEQKVLQPDVVVKTIQSNIYARIGQAIPRKVSSSDMRWFVSM